MEQMKCVLGLYCAEGGFLLSLIANGKEPVEAVSKEKTSDNLVACVLELLQKAKMQPTDIDTIVVCIGPGSFTGNRVAVSFVKGFASGKKNTKIVPFSSFEFLAFEKECDVVLVPAFSNFVYAKIGNTEQCAEFEKLALSGKRVVTEPETARRLQDCLIVEPNKNFSKFVQSKAKDKGVLLQNLHPVYLRASQAEIEREKRLKK